MHEQNSNLHRHLNLQVGSGTGEKPAGAEVRMRVGQSRDLPFAVPIAPGIPERALGYLFL